MSDNLYVTAYHSFYYTERNQINELHTNGQKPYNFDRNLIFPFSAEERKSKGGYETIPKPIKQVLNSEEMVKNGKIISIPKVIDFLTNKMNFNNENRRQDFIGGWALAFRNSKYTNLTLFLYKIVFRIYFDSHHARLKYKNKNVFNKFRILSAIAFGL